MLPNIDGLSVKSMKVPQSCFRLSDRYMVGRPNVIFGPFSRRFYNGLACQGHICPRYKSTEFRKGSLQIPNTTAHTPSPQKKGEKPADLFSLFFPIFFFFSWGERQNVSCRCSVIRLPTDRALLLATIRHGWIGEGKERGRATLFISTWPETHHKREKEGIGCSSIPYFPQQFFSCKKRNCAMENGECRYV